VANIASVLKEEITRLARKEIKSETEVLKKAASQYRSEIVDLKRRAVALEKQLSKLGKEVGGNTPPKSEVSPDKIRFVAKGFKSMRQKLGITAKETSVLLDISAPTIYNWEAGISKPKQPQLIRIAHLRTMNKKDVADVLAHLATPTPKAKAKTVKKPQTNKAAPKATVKPAPKAVKSTTAIKSPARAETATNKQPAKKVQKAIDKPAPKAVAKVINNPAEPVNVTAPAPIPAPVIQTLPDSQAEV
jgi:transcriptional regulator with XRE-family HTH domain